MTTYSPNQVLVPGFNQYTSQAVPTTFVLQQSAARTTSVGTTGTVTMATATVPAGMLGPNDGLRITALFSGPSSANAKTYSILAGGTTIQTVTVTTATVQELPVTLRNANSTSVQSCSYGNFGAEPSPGNLQTLTINTANAFNVVFQIQAVSSGETIALEGYTIEVLRADVGTQTSTTTNPTLRLDFVNQQYQAGTPLSPYTFGGLITFTRSTTATYFDSSGTLQTSPLNTPRFDYNPSTLAAQGLLIEEARTNGLRNNTAQGAVVGAPGTLPNNWAISTSLTGLSTEIVAVSTDAGITYVDIRVSGTPSAGGNWGITMDTGTATPAASGQTWAFSMYVKLVAGSLVNINNATNYINETNAGGGYITGSGTAFVPTAAALVSQRVSHIRTLTNGSTANVQPLMQFNLSGGAIDITLRFGLPQLEQGAFPTSVIPTTTAAVTRAADLASVNTVSPWINQSASTVYCEASTQFKVGDLASFWSLTDSTGRNFLAVGASNLSSNNRIQASQVYNNAPYFNGAYGANGSYTAGTTVKTALATQTNDGQLASSGATIGLAQTAFIEPVVSQLVLGGYYVVGNRLINGYLRRLIYYPTRLPNSLIASMTA